MQKHFITLATSTKTFVFVNSYKNQRRKMKMNLRKLLLVFAFALLTQSISAQTEIQDDEIKKRDVLSNAFTRNRPGGNKSNVQNQPSLPRRYKGKKVIRAKAKRIPSSTATPTKATSNKGTSSKPTPAITTPISEMYEERLGITMWRLRPEQNSDTGPRILKMGKSTKLVPERVSFETTFRLKDKVRLTIEAPREGYLYIVDREINKNGLGDPYLIFPTLRTRNGYNRVGPGSVVEIPSQTDDPPYFDIAPLSEDYAGEMLTVIISSEPLPNLQLTDEALKIPLATFTKWEEDWEETADVLELEDGEKMTYTESENKAGQGTSQITQNDPAPQTMFEIKVPKGRTYMVSFPMKVTSEK
jgi:hypothetical protein